MKRKLMRAQKRDSCLLPPDTVVLVVVVCVKSDWTVVLVNTKRGAVSKGSPHRNAKKKEKKKKKKSWP